MKKNVNKLDITFEEDPEIQTESESDEVEGCFMCQPEKYRNNVDEESQNDSESFQHQHIENLRRKAKA